MTAAAPATDNPAPPPAAVIDLSDFNPRSLVSLEETADTLASLGEFLTPALKRPRVADAATKATVHAAFAAFKAAGPLIPRLPELGDHDLEVIAAAATIAAATLVATATVALAHLYDRGVAARGPLVSADGVTSIRAGASNLVDPAGRAVKAEPPRRQQEGEVWAHPETAATAPPYTEATCIACGCTKGNACQLLAADGTVITTCAWRQVDPTTNAGVCSACSE